MTTFTFSCIASDRSGQAKVFRAGQRVVMRSDNCPQIDGVVDHVRACFYQNQTLGDHGMAVLLEKHSWSYCRDLETQEED